LINSDENTFYEAIDSLVNSFKKLASILTVEIKDALKKG